MRVALDLRMVRHTGIGAYLRGLVPRLSAPDLELLLLVPAGLAPPEPIPVGATVVEWRDAPAVYSPREQWAYAAVLAGRDVDLLHVPHFHAPILGGPPLVVTIHDIVFRRFPEELPHPGKRAWAQAMLAIVVRRARRILTDSRFVADELVVGMGVPSEKVIPAPLGVPAPAGPPPGPAEVRAVRERFGLPEDFVLSVGMQRPRKNLVRLVRAFARSGLARRGVVLALAGPPDPRGREVADEVVRRNLAGSVTTLGFVSDPELAALYAGARLLAFPSLYEGFGFPAVEAMAAGLPVAAARAGSLPEVCGEAAEWFDPEDVDGMAGALARVHDDAGLRSRLVAAGRGRVEGGLSWARAAEATIRAYREALGAPLTAR